MLAIYCRISQDKEEGENRSIKNQKSIGIEFAHKYGLVYKVYSDEGLSGTLENIEDRPSLHQLILDIHEGKIQQVFVTDQSRLERNPRLGYAIKDIFRKNNIKLFTSSGIVDINDPQANFLSDMTSLINEFYVKITQKKIKEVLSQNAKNGKSHGILPYGFTKDKDNFLMIDEEESKIVEEIYALSLQGKGTKKIAEILSERNVLTRYNKIAKGNLKVRDRFDKNVLKTINKSDIKWSGKTVRDIIKNPIYKGERHFGGKTYSCPAILNKNYWEKVNANLPLNRNNNGKKVNHKYMLKGLIKCGRCSNYMYGRTRVNKKDNYYMCSSKRYKNKNCGNRSINIDILETFIWNRFFENKMLYQSVIKYYKSEKHNIEGLKLKMKSLRTSLNQFELRRKRAIKIMVQGLISQRDLEIELKSLNQSKSDCTMRIKKLNEQISRIENAGSVITDLKNHSNNLKNLSWNEKRDLVQKYIQRIIVEFDDKEHYLITILIENQKNREHFVMNYKERIPYFDLVKALEVKNYTYNLHYSNS